VKKSKIPYDGIREIVVNMLTKEQDQHSMLLDHLKTRFSFEYDMDSKALRGILDTLQMIHKARLEVLKNILDEMSKL